MSDYRGCDSRDFCDERAQELDAARSSLEEIYRVACDIGRAPDAALAIIAGICERAGIGNLEPQCAEHS